MKNKKSSNKSKKIVALLAVVIVAAGAALVVVHYHRTSTNPVLGEPRPVNTVSYAPSKPSDNTANNQRKSNPSTAAPTLDNGSTKATNAQNISVTVTRAGVNAGNLQVGTLVSNATSGTCILSAAQTGQTTITQSETLALQNNSYVCPVFNIPTTQFPNQGKWNISVTVTSNGSSATGNWQNNPVALS